MPTTELERRPKTATPDNALRSVILSLSSSLKTLADDILLEQTSNVEYIYAIDFQELYNYMYPLGKGDITLDPANRQQLKLEDVLATRILQEESRGFVLLEGTYLELLNHIRKVEREMGKVKGIGLDARRKENIARLRDSLLSRTHQDQDIAFEDRPFQEAVSDIAAALGEHQEAFARLDRFISTKVMPLDLSSLGNAVSIKSTAYHKAFQALSGFRTGRGGDEHRNEADALNLASITTLNEAFSEAYANCRTDKHVVVRLFTHTKTIFRFSSASNQGFEPSCWLGGRRVPLLARPMLLYVHQLAGDQGPSILTFQNLHEKHARLETALASYDIVHWRLQERNQTLEGLLENEYALGALLQEIEPDKILSEHLEKLDFLNRDPLVSKATTTLQQIARVEDTEDAVEDTPLEGEPSIPTARLLRSANQICDQLGRIRQLMHTANPAAYENAISKLTQGGKMRTKREGFFAAERYRFVRQMDHEYNRDFGCFEHRLISPDGRVALSMDLYSEYFVASWPTRCNVKDFILTVSDILIGTAYESADGEFCPEVNGVILIKTSGEVEVRPLHLPLEASALLEEMHDLALVRINARRVAFCCELLNRLGTAVTGLVGQPDSTIYIRPLHRNAGGTLPDPPLQVEVDFIERHFRGTR